MIAIIGGSGLYSGMEALEEIREESMETRQGTVPYLAARLEGIDVVFLSRHGTDDKVPPHLIPYKTNMRVLKKLGVERILATSAVGSLDREIPLGTLVLPDQFIDFTKQNHTFFEGGKSGLVHLNLSEPFCPHMRNLLHQTAQELKYEAVLGGTYACIEGPHFETLAEARMLRQWGGTLAGMTAVHEAKLARELQMCYQVVCVPVDYPAEPEGEVSHAQTLRIMGESSERMAGLFARVVSKVAKSRNCDCGSALEGATG